MKLHVKIKLFCLQIKESSIFVMNANKYWIFTSLRKKYMNVIQIFLVSFGENNLSFQLVWLKYISEENKRLNVYEKDYCMALVSFPANPVLTCICWTDN